VLVGLLGVLPRAIVEGLAGALGDLAWSLGIRRRVTLENLRNAFPEKDEAERTAIARAAYRNMALAALEAMSAATLSETDLATLLTTEGAEAFFAAVDQGKGVLVATAHFGNWELLGSVMARRGVPVHAVVRPLKGSLNDRIVKSRLRNGLRLIPPRGAVLGSVKAVRSGGVVAMLVDQVLPQKHGVFVPFFGRPACTNPSLAIAALRTGAPVFVGMAAREGKRLKLFFEGPFPVPQTGDALTNVREHTAQITSVLERYIRRYPDQWLWMHRRWKVQPDA
jgi:Kdo2-lipid IVA lauroyltransferase/acyltransferase